MSRPLNSRSYSRKYFVFTNYHEQPCYQLFCTNIHSTDNCTHTQHSNYQLLLTWIIMLTWFIMLTVNMKIWHVYISSLEYAHACSIRETGIKNQQRNRKPQSYVSTLMKNKQVQFWNCEKVLPTVVHVYKFIQNNLPVVTHRWQSITSRMLFQQTKNA